MLPIGFSSNADIGLTEDIICEFKRAQLFTMSVGTVVISQKSWLKTGIGRDISLRELRSTPSICIQGSHHVHHSVTM